MAKISPLVIAPPVIFAALAGLFFGGMFRQDPDALPSTLIGTPAPPLQTTPLGTGAPPDETVFANNDVTLVNYWASWCAPCRVEHPQLIALKDQGIPIIGVNYKDDPAKALAFLAELGDPYDAIGADEKGRTALNWGVYGVPETFVVDGDGTVILRFAGPVTDTVLSKRILPAIETALAK